MRLDRQFHAIHNRSSTGPEREGPRPAKAPILGMVSMSEAEAVRDTETFVCQFNIPESLELIQQKKRIPSTEGTCEGERDSDGG